MKIYEIGTGYTPIPAQIGAATEIVVEELTRSLINNGVKAEIIDIKSDNRQATELPITEVTVPLFFSKTDTSLGIVHKLKRVIYSVSLAQRLKKILKSEKDKMVLHFHNQYNLFFAFKLIPKRLLQKAIIAYTVHSYIWGTEWEKIESTVKSKYFQEIYCVKNADVVFVLNDLTAEHFEKHLGVKRENIRKISNGVNLQRYSPLSSEETAKIKAENAFSSKKIIFQVGSVCERKNQLGSLKMLAEYMHENRDVVFLYAGGIIDDDYFRSISDFAEENGIQEQVIYVGELSPGEQLNKYYNMADCSVFTSVLESFGLVIIEAIAAGTRVIVGSNLMFDLDGGYDMYRSEKEFVSMVDGALNSPKNGQIPSCLEKYGWDAVASEYFNQMVNCEK